MLGTFPQFARKGRWLIRLGILARQQGISEIDLIREKAQF